MALPTSHALTRKKSLDQNDRNAQLSRWSSCLSRGELRALLHTTLCRRCQQIQLDKKFEQAHSTLHFVLDINFSTFDPECNLCALLQPVTPHKAIRQALSPYERSRWFTAIDLRSGDNAFPGYISFNEFWLHSAPKSAQPDRHRVSGRRFSSSTGGPYRATRLVDPLAADLASLKSKFHYCLQSHQHVCDAVERYPVPCLKVINCTTRRLELATLDTRYVALSYVWGSPSPSATPTNPDPLPKVLEKTFEDAITVTLELGGKYLWIDRFCINQADPDKHAQIQQMDAVFRNAELTIVAAAGENPTFGLPGVSTTPRATQPCCRIGHYLFSRSLEGDQYLLNASKWNSRAWVYQEYRFSRRRLVFTNRYAWFCCGIIAPAYGSEIETGSSWKLSGAQEKVQGPRKQSHNLSYAGSFIRPWTLAKLIREYSRRSLTYPSDAINAFAGILRAFQNTEYPVYHIWGSPILPPVAIPLADNDHSGDVVLLSRSTSDGFVLSLCWRTDGTAAAGLPGVNRRACFPSWSWTGWEGAVSFRGYSERCSAVNIFESQFEWGDATEVGVLVETNDGQVMCWERFETMGYMKDVQAALSPFIWLEAWTMCITLRRFPMIGRREEQAIADGMGSLEVWAILEAEQGGDRFAKAELLVEAADDYLENRTFTGIILGSLEGQSSQYPFVLLVEEKLHWAERVGSLFLGYEEVMDSLEKQYTTQWNARPLKMKRRTIRLG